MMKHKTAGKHKGKASYVEVAALDQQPGGLKTSPSGKSGKPNGLNPEVEVAAAKPKLTYASHPAPAAQMHDAGLGVQFADFPTTGLDMTPREREAELAEELVGEVAHDGTDVNALCETYHIHNWHLPLQASETLNPFTSNWII